MSDIQIVAEIGCNHNGSVELAKKMMKKAKEAGADAVKFQSFVPENLVSRYAPKAEAEQLRKKVEQSGMSQQEYILSCVLNKPITNTDGIKELIPELKRVGNNLNQIAHALNGGRYYQYNLITDNQKELDKVWQSLKQFLQKQA